MSSAAVAQTAHISRAVLKDSILPILAHELREPLSAMESIAYYLDLVIDQKDQRAREHASRLHGFVAQANWILSCALELANDRPTAPVLTDVEELITQTLAAHVLPGDAGPELHFVENPPLILLDPGRARPLMENLLGMFERLTAGAHRVLVATSCYLAQNATRRVVVEISVATPGYASEQALGPGSALCLQSLRHAVELHGGIFQLMADPLRGIRARVEFPAASEASAV